MQQPQDASQPICIELLLLELLYKFQPKVCFYPLICIVSILKVLPLRTRHIAENEEQRQTQYYA